MIRYDLEIFSKVRDKSSFNFYKTALAFGKLS